MEEIIVTLDLSDPDLWIDYELYGPVACEPFLDDSLLEDILETVASFWGF